MNMEELKRKYTENYVKITRRRIIFAVCIIVEVIIAAWFYSHRNTNIPAYIMVLSIGTVVVIYFILSAIADLIPVKNKR
jgi:Na+/glutamate symporter